MRDFYDYCLTFRFESKQSLEAKFMVFLVEIFYPLLSIFFHSRLTYSLRAFCKLILTRRVMSLGIVNHCFFPLQKVGAGAPKHNNLTKNCSELQKQTTHEMTVLFGLTCFEEHAFERHFMIYWKYWSKVFTIVVSNITRYYGYDK